MTGILAAQPAELRTKGDALIRQADKLLCESWNERMWADGEPIDRPVAHGGPGDQRRLRSVVRTKLFDQLAVVSVISRPSPIDREQRRSHDVAALTKTGAPFRIKR